MNLRETCLAFRYSVGFISRWNSFFSPLSAALSFYIGAQSLSFLSLSFYRLSFISFFFSFFLFIRLSFPPPFLSSISLFLFLLPFFSHSNVSFPFHLPRFFNRDSYLPYRERERAFKFAFRMMCIRVILPYRQMSCIKEKSQLSTINILKSESRFFSPQMDITWSAASIISKELMGANIFVIYEIHFSPTSFEVGEKLLPRKK